MSTTKPTCFLLWLIFLFCSACSPIAHGGQCALRYTPDLMNKLVIPELKKNFSGAYVYFDFDDPVTFEEHGNFIVQLSATKMVGGRHLAFEDLFLIEIDPCTQKVLRSYATQQYHRE